MGDVLYALDFQDARMGPYTYDLVSLLWDPYANLKDELRDPLLKEWKQKSVGLHKDIEEELHRMKIQRLLKAIGSYSSFYLDKGNPSCFSFIEMALFDSLSSFAWLCDMNKLNKDEKKLQSWLEKVYKRVLDQ
jgi:hypothetical protein